MPIMSEDEHNALAHYGIKRKSGRYPWGSGRTPEERGASFQKHLSDLRKQGLSDTQIAKGFGMTTTELRATIAIARNAKHQDNVAQARTLKAKGMSNQAIAERMFGSKSKESTVRSLLAPGAKDKADILMETTNALRNRVDEARFVDIGKGVANQLGISETKLGNARAVLESEGYVVHKVKVPQMGTKHETIVKVMCPPGTEWKDVMQNLDKIQQFKAYSDDHGRTIIPVQKPISIDSKRIQVIHKEEGGDKADGVIYVRPGAKDLDMGANTYAQVRILVDGTHYMKGMAVLKDDLPPGVDIQFNTNKKKGTPLLGSKDNSVLKPVSDDPENPFGAITRQIPDEHGNVKSALNLVNTQEDWEDWSRNLSTQMLSKQKPVLIKNQLEVTYAKKKAQLDEIMALTNPTVKARLLQSYADDMDASSVHLKAAALPGQRTHVLLPINSLRENEIYAPNYDNGTTVVLVRYPHGGIFEIPELTVNNRNAEGRRTIGQSHTAVGIHHKVAARLSGADFDGDTVVVIPNNQKRVITSHPLEGLKGFDPQAAYPGVEGVTKKMTNTQTEMGKISNLITDMTLAGADDHELARAVRHSMVVIDAEKHGLDYVRSARENNIAELRKKYQPKPGGRSGGASTLISRTSAKIDVPDRRLARKDEGGPIDPITGKLNWVPSGKTYNKRTVDPKTGEVTWVPTLSKTKVARGALTDDAHTLSSGLYKEQLYADYSNRVKDLANRARLELVHNTEPTPYSDSARQTYHKEVDSLNAKLDVALRNAPLERQAQVIAGAIVKMKRDANPHMDEDTLKKVKSQALETARNRTGAKKQRVQFTQEEWNAVQAGAIRHSRLKELLNHADIDEVKQLATPRTTALMSSTNVSRARALAGAGYTQKEIADELGVSLSTLQRALKG